MNKNAGHVLPILTTFVGFKVIRISSGKNNNCNTRKKYKNYRPGEKREYMLVYMPATVMAIICLTRKEIVFKTLSGCFINTLTITFIAFITNHRWSSCTQ